MQAMRDLNVHTHTHVTPNRSLELAKPADPEDLPIPIAVPKVALPGVSVVAAEQAIAAAEAAAAAVQGVSVGSAAGSGEQAGTADESGASPKKKKRPNSKVCVVSEREGGIRRWVGMGWNIVHRSISPQPIGDASPPAQPLTTNPVPARRRRFHRRGVRESHAL